MAGPFVIPNKFVQSTIMMVLEFRIRCRNVNGPYLSFRYFPARIKAER